MRRIAVLLATLAFAACGGGGSSPIPTVTQPPTTHKVSIGAGFAKSNINQSRGRRTAMDRALDVSLLSLPPTYQIDVPDPYITQQPGETGAPWIFVYLNTSDGTLAGLPNPLPTPAYAQTGPSIPVLTVNPAPMPTPSTAPVELGYETLGRPTQPGIIAITASAPVNGQTLSANVTIDAYPAMCIIAPNSYQNDGCVAGLYWDAAGGEHTTTDTTQADAYMVLNSGGTTSFVFNSGATTVASSDGLIPMTSCPSVAAGPTTIPSLAIDQTVPVIAFKTATGFCVKWQADSFDSGTGSGGVNTGNIGEAYGMYLVSDASGNFAY